MTRRISVLAARIIITGDARDGRESDPRVVALAKKKIYNPHGAEIRYRWPEKRESLGQESSRAKPRDLSSSREIMRVLEARRVVARDQDAGRPSDPEILELAEQTVRDLQGTEIPFRFFELPPPTAPRRPRRRWKLFR